MCEWPQGGRWISPDSCHNREELLRTKCFDMEVTTVTLNFVVERKLLKTRILNSFILYDVLLKM
jgi:hypothetical protein